MILQVLEGLEWTLSIASVAVVRKRLVLQGADDAMPALQLLLLLLRLLLLHAALLQHHLLAPQQVESRLVRRNKWRRFDVSDRAQAASPTREAGRLLQRVLQGAPGTDCFQRRGLCLAVLPTTRPHAQGRGLLLLLLLDQDRPHTLASRHRSPLRRLQPSWCPACRFW